MSCCALPDCSIPGDSRCSRCKQIFYCSKEHQKQHWPKHKLICKEPAVQRQEEEYKSTDFSGLIKASQHGTVRLSPSSNARGLATDGMSACVALIFFSETTGKMSLSHTPLRPSKSALQGEAEWTGEGTKLIIVQGYTYANPATASKNEWPSVLGYVENALKQVGVLVQVYPTVASRGCVGVTRSQETGKFRIMVPTNRMNTGQQHSNPNLDYIGFSLYDIQTIRPSSNLHYNILQLSGKMENLMSDGLSLLLEYDGEKWIPEPVLPAMPLSIVTEYQQSNKISIEFLRQCEWTREDGFNGQNANPWELDMAAKDFEASVGIFIRLKKQSSRKKLSKNKRK